jgi:hypothetical protein
VIQNQHLTQFNPKKFISSFNFFLQKTKTKKVKLRTLETAQPIIMFLPESLKTPASIYAIHPEKMVPLTNAPGKTTKIRGKNCQKKYKNYCFKTR